MDGQNPGFPIHHISVGAAWHTSKGDTAPVGTAYDDTASAIYDNGINKSFAYGQLTLRFLNQVVIDDSDATVVDIGCGTGFAFEVLRHHFKGSVIGVGVDASPTMLKLARQKFRDSSNLFFVMGLFENLPLRADSADKVISSLALHWAASVERAAAEIRRVLRSTGSAHILMIANDDAAGFSRPVFNALRKHLCYGELVKAIRLAQRLDAQQVFRSFGIFGDRYEIEVTNWKEVFYGDFEKHMQWWKSRSAALIAAVENKERFMMDLREEFKKIETEQGIPLDTSCFHIGISPKPRGG